MTRRAERSALAVLLVGTAVAYIWGLGSAGWANSFYSAAVQAGTVSWKAALFGSSDAANSITVDKPPASLWVMEASTRLFGVNSWAILVPQALLGVASVALLYAAVRRRFGATAGLIAGLILATTPVAALMFRFNNPDALLVLLMIAATWAMLRAVEPEENGGGRWRWLLLCGLFVGLGFLTKQLAVMLIVPGLALTYLVAGPSRIGRRLVQLCAAGGAAVVGAGWWLLLVQLWPAGSRPWIGGSQTNSILELTLGYNGLGRLSGDERGSVVPGRGESPFGGSSPFGDVPGFPGGEFPGHPGGRGGGMWGDPSVTRMFQPEQIGQIAWLLVAALLALVLVLVLRGRAPRTDGDRAAVLAWGSWLLVTGLTFSLMQGIFHAYYTVALAPAIAALVGIGIAVGWRERHRAAVRVVGAIAVAATGISAWSILSLTPAWVPWLRWAVAATAALGTVGLLATVALPHRSGRAGRVLAAVIAFAALAGPVAFTAETIATPRHGSIVSAGPSSGHGFGPGGGRHLRGGMPAAMRRMFGGPEGRPGGTGHGGPGGGLLEGAEPGPALVTVLTADRGFTWAAATVGANSAAGYLLATGLPVMPIGGFNGTDPSPTLAQFQRYVAEGRIHYFIAGGGFAMMGGGEGTAKEITSWVEEHFTARTVDGVTVYDLTAPK